MVKKIDLKLFLVLLLSRIAILILPILFWQFSGRTDLQFQNLFNHWTIWDASHFVYIAQYGYTNVGDPANFIVFPPLYPLAIKLFSAFLFNSALSAITVSILSFSFAGVLFCKIVSQVWDKGIAKRALFLLAIFPTSYFLAAPYTESLFWLIAMLTIWFSLKKNWILAGIFTGLAFLTRFPGILLLLPMIINLKQTRQKIVNFLLVLLPFAFCIFIYLFINWKTYGDWFAFSKILHDHWQKTFAFPWTSLTSSWHAALGGSDDYAIQVGWWEAIPATIGVILIPFVFKNLKNTAWSVWYLLNIMLITSTSFLLSTPRYLLAIPPLFVFLAIISKKFPVIYYVWVFISAGLLTYFSMRFVTGQWSF